MKNPLKNQDKENRDKLSACGNRNSKMADVSNDYELLSGTVFPGSNAEVFDRRSANKHEVLICNTGKTQLYIYLAESLGDEVPPESWLLKPGKSLIWEKVAYNGTFLFVFNPHKEQNGFFTVKLI